jgi:CSLREA domain-containing protein
MIELSEKRPVESKNSMKILALGFVVAALLAASLMITARPAHADATFTVTNPFDPGDGNCNTSCTLREAITAVNNTPGADTIRFNMPGEGVKTVSPTSELPTITEAVTIDGYTQPGAKENTQQVGSDAVLLIQLDGSKAGEAAGLRIKTSNVVVRGLVINRFGGNVNVDGNGIVIEGGSATGNTVEGNRIGTDPTGTQALGNDDDGILVIDGTRGNLIGGPAPAARNLISGNGDDGVHLRGNSNRVENNYLGTDASGGRPLGNSLGVFLEDSTTNTVIGNLIRSNLLEGVLVSGSTRSQVKANTIAFNGDEGVEVRADSTRSRILSNSIFSNDDPSSPRNDLGIDLGNLGDGDGPTPNDPGDADEGANGLQNRPAVASAVTSGGTNTLKGRLDSTPNTDFIVQFFANPSGGDEGKTFLGQKKVTTNSEGKVSFTFSPSRKVGVGKTVTATATGSEGTSEFSAPRTVVSA